MRTATKRADRKTTPRCVLTFRLGSAADGLVGDVERAVDDLECLAQLRLRDAQRWVGVDRVVGDHRVQVVIAEVLPDRLHLVARTVEWGERGERIAAADEVED